MALPTILADAISNIREALSDDRSANAYNCLKAVDFNLKHLRYLVVHSPRDPFDSSCRKVGEQAAGYLSHVRGASIRPGEPFLIAQRSVQQNALRALVQREETLECARPSEEAAGLHIWQA